MLLETAIGPSALTPNNFRAFPNDSSYYPPPHHEGAQQLLTLPYFRRDQRGSNDYRTRPVMSRGRADCLESLFSLARPGDQLNRVSWVSRSPRLAEPPLVVESESGVPRYDPEDPENVRGAMIGSLSLDRNVESNALPFLLHT
ncbi:hypothetical protein FRC11_011345, partial [Ceratobasidium sp. 423]